MHLVLGNSHRSSSELVRSILSSPDVVADVRLGCATVSFHPLPVSLDIHEEDYQVVNFIALAIQGIAAKFEGLQEIPASPVAFFRATPSITLMDRIPNWASTKFSLIHCP